MHTPDRALVQRFVLGTAERGEARLFLRHLLAGCPDCSRTVRELADLQAGARSARPESQYDGAIDRLVARVKSGAEAHVLEADLALRSHKGLMARNVRRFGSRALCERLLHQSHAQRLSDPAGMLRAAELAVLVANNLSQHSAGAEVSDLQALASAQLGNALRVNGRVLQAGSAFDCARAHLAQGTGDLPLRAEIYERHACYLQTVHRWREAIDLLDAAILVHRNRGFHQGIARALIEKAIAIGWNTEPANGLVHLEEATPHLANFVLLDRELLCSRPDEQLPENSEALNLLRFHAQALLWFLLEMEEFEHATHVYLDTRRLFEDAPGTLRLKQTWNEARLFAGLGQFGPAEHRLREVADAFAARGNDLYSAQASLDLCRLLAQQGRVLDVRELARSVHTVVLGIAGQEALASIILLAKSDANAEQLARLAMRAARQLATGAPARA